MAKTEAECEAMIRAASAADVRLMIAYRLHFEPSSLRALACVRSGQIGDPRSIDSVFTMQVEPGNVRLSAGLGGGPLYDIGIYCINAARSLFGAEPTEVCAFSDRTAADARFREVPEQVGAVMRFPGGRVASFIAGFGAADAARCEVIGTRGRVRLEPAYHHSGALGLEIEVGGKRTRKTFKGHDQVAPEIAHFSDCIREHREPGPSGREGLADVRVIRAILESAASGQAVAIEPISGSSGPSPSQEHRVPAHRSPELINAESPSR